MSRYIECLKLSANGHHNECWQAVRLEANLLMGTGRLIVVGWKDAALCAAGAREDDVLQIDVNIGVLSSYTAVFSELALILVGAGGCFEGGSVKELPTPAPTAPPEPDSDPVLTPVGQ